MVVICPNLMVNKFILMLISTSNVHFAFTFSCSELAVKNLLIHPDNKGGKIGKWYRWIFYL